jgi:hypothetical protein
MMDRGADYRPAIRFAANSLPFAMHWHSRLFNTSHVRPSSQELLRSLKYGWSGQAHQRAVNL